MDRTTFLLAATPVNAWLSGVGWIWPFIQIAHLIGMCLLIGSLIIVDLRVIGLFRSTSIAGALAFRKIAGFGLLINMASGALFVLGDPARFMSNPVFRIKLSLLALAAVNIAFFHAWASRGNGDNARLRQPYAALSAGLSLMIWFLVIAAGRMMASFE
jgi:hypothetical protein